MGLPWISVKTNLPTHRKSFELGVRLQDPRAWCYLVQLWCWAAENEPTGKLSGDRRASVAEHFAGWTGEPGKFVAEAVAVGFMDDDGDTLELHDWDEHQGAHIAKAERDAERIRKKRAELRKEQRRASVARQSQDESANVALASRVRGEERRGEEKKQLPEASAAAAAAPPEVVETPEEQTPVAAPAPKPRKQPDSRHHTTVGLFCLLFLDLGRGAYRVMPADGAAVKKLLTWSEATDAEIERRMRFAFCDQFFREKNPSLSFFVSKWNAWSAPKQQCPNDISPKAKAFFETAPDDCTHLF